MGEKASIHKYVTRFRQYLKTEHLSYTLAAYNNMLPAQVGHISCHLIGFQIVAQLALEGHEA